MPDPRIFPITACNDTFGTATGVSGVILAENLRRVDCDFVNDSEYVVYLGRGNAAVVGSGIRLNAGGGSYRIATDNMWYGTITAIIDEAQETANITISEGYLP